MEKPLLHEQLQEAQNDPEKLKTLFCQKLLEDRRSQAEITRAMVNDLQKLNKDKMYHVLQTLQLLPKTTKPCAEEEDFFKGKAIGEAQGWNRACEALKKKIEKVMDVLFSNQQ